jgi:hypothetical protein
MVECKKIVFFLLSEKSETYTVLIKHIHNNSKFSAVTTKVNKDYTTNFNKSLVRLNNISEMRIEKKTKKTKKTKKFTKKERGKPSSKEKREKKEPRRGQISFGCPEFFFILFCYLLCHFILFCLLFFCFFSFFS